MTEEEYLSQQLAKTEFYVNASDVAWTLPALHHQNPEYFSMGNWSGYTFDFRSGYARLFSARVSDWYQKQNADSLIAHTTIQHYGSPIAFADLSPELQPYVDAARKAWHAARGITAAEII